MTTPSSASNASLLSSTKGVTVFELLIAVAIIGVLAALLTPAASWVKGQANDTRCVSQLRQIGGFTQVFIVENRGYLPSSYHRSAINPLGNRYWFEQIARGGGIETLEALRVKGNLFQCPNSKAPWAVEQQRYFGNYGWNIAAGNEWREDEYQPYLLRFRRDALDGSKTVLLGDTNHGAYQEGLASHWFSTAGYLDARHGNGHRVNLLFLDNSVRSIRKEEITTALLRVTSL